MERITHLMPLISKTLFAIVVEKMYTLRNRAQQRAGNNNQNGQQSGQKDIMLQNMSVKEEFGTKPYREAFCVDDESLTMEIDTEAARTIMPERLYKAPFCNMSHLRKHLLSCLHTANKK